MIFLRRNGDWLLTRYNTSATHDLCVWDFCLLILERIRQYSSRFAASSCETMYSPRMTHFPSMSRARSSHYVITKIFNVGNKRNLETQNSKTQSARRTNRYLAAVVPREFPSRVKMQNLCRAGGTFSDAPIISRKEDALLKFSHGACGIPTHASVSILPFVSRSVLPRWVLRFSSGYSLLKIWNPLGAGRVSFEISIISAPLKYFLESLSFQSSDVIFILAISSFWILVKRHLILKFWNLYDVFWDVSHLHW